MVVLCVQYHASELVSSLGVILRGEKYKQAILRALFVSEAVCGTVRLRERPRLRCDIMKCREIQCIFFFLLDFNFRLFPRFLGCLCRVVVVIIRRTSGVCEVPKSVLLKLRAVGCPKNEKL